MPCTGGAWYLNTNRSLMHTLTRTMIPPAPAPCTARPAINMAIFLAAAQTAELMANTTIAARRVGLRPHMSDSLAQMGDETADVRRYAAPIHVKPAEEAKAWEMLGKAVVTTEKSRADRKSVSWSHSV
jgi:hypothetical protein